MFEEFFDGVSLKDFFLRNMRVRIKSSSGEVPFSRHDVYTLEFFLDRISEFIRSLGEIGQHAWYSFANGWDASADIPDYHAVSFYKDGVEIAHIKFWILLCGDLEHEIHHELMPHYVYTHRLPDKNLTCKFYVDSNTIPQDDIGTYGCGKFRDWYGEIIPQGDYKSIWVHHEETYSKIMGNFDYLRYTVEIEPPNICSLIPTTMDKCAHADDWKTYKPLDRKNGDLWVFDTEN